MKSKYSLKLGIALINKKMKLKLEINHLKKEIVVPTSFIDKIKYLFNKKQKKIKSDLKTKGNNLRILDEIINNNKEKMDIEIDEQMKNFINNNQYTDLKKYIENI